MTPGRFFAIAATGAAGPAVLISAGCRSVHNSLEPAGVQAESIADLWWLYFWICALAYALVMIAVVWATLRRRRSRPSDFEGAPVELSPLHGNENRMTFTVGAALALVTLLLFVLLFGDYLTGRSLHSLSTEDAVKVRLTARQWWWEVRYEGENPSQMVTTANEIHVPVGRTVELQMESPDVIHSFWAPNLHGKRDIIPGYTTRILFRADRPGSYWGQCAEFCGVQHANMRFVVVAESEETYQAWIDAQRATAPEPSNDSQKRGRDVFLARSCSLCHAIQGTPASGMVGPDLTHVASRWKIAETLPNTRGHLAGWIVDPQRIKPGVHMPMNTLEPEELRSLLDYLETLK